MTTADRQEPKSNTTFAFRGGQKPQMKTQKQKQKTQNEHLIDSVFLLAQLWDGNSIKGIPIENDTVY